MILNIFKRLKNLETTIKTLEKEITKLSMFTDETFPEDPNLSDYESFEDFSDYNEINKIRQRRWILLHPSLKIKKIFHGGCLSCNTPLEEGIKICLKCQYFNADWNLKDLSKKINK